MFGWSVGQRIESHFSGLMNTQLVGAFLMCQFVLMPRWILSNVVDQLCLDKHYLSASHQMRLLYSTASIYSIIMSIDRSNLVQLLALLNRNIIKTYTDFIHSYTSSRSLATNLTLVPTYTFHPWAGHRLLLHQDTLPIRYQHFPMTLVVRLSKVNGRLWWKAV